MPDLGPRRLYALAEHAVVFELRLYRSLFRWLVRRPDLGGPEDTAFTYARTVTPVMWLWIFASAAELPLVHLLIPWDGLRIALLVVGVWGLVWMVGLLASLYVYPHLLGPAELRVRYGASHSITLPWTSVATVTHRQRDLDSSVWTLQPRDTEHGTDLQVAVSGQVNVHARLHAPTTVPTAKGDMEISELSFFADDPRAFVAHARTVLAREPEGRQR
ncbi:MAG TPA: hypothetical protein VFR87_20295 [Nocardioidaceae bacterium]|nr:hypothetical protein [Nocardioidaceae bacterium]